MAQHPTPSHHFLASLTLVLALCLQVQGQSSTCPPEVETITTSIPENVPDGSLVYDFEERFPVHFGRLFFFFDSPDVERVFYSHFTRDGSTNVITTSGNDFDRDEIADELGNYVAPVVFNITVSSYDIVPMLQIVECVYLVINVIDADDEVPQFTTASLMIEFRDDDEELRQFTTLPLAPDKDEGDNGTRVYYLEDSIDQTFELEILKDRHTQEIEVVLLRNIKPLNREERDVYFLTLVASEGKDNPDTATLPIVVKINDTCDEDPDFGTSGYSLLIAEDTRIGHTIMQLHAEDLDLGVYGTVTYHIKTVCTQKVVGDTCITFPEAEQLFDLDMETGNLVLQQELDREEQAQYDIVVEAVDGCGLSSTATVAIQVQGQQSSTCPPEVKTITTSIPENVPDGSLVYDFEERFPVHFGRLFFFFDSPDVERVFYSHFTRDGSTNVITTSGNDFDRDEIADELGNYVAPVVFNITVSSYDIVPMLQIVECVHLVINVIDADDEVPQFTTASLMIEFRDDDEELRQFTTLPLAPDKDEGDNGTRVYYLEDSIDQTFELEILKDRHTQEIEVVLLRNIKPLNREERDVYFLTLVASEGKDNPDTATLPIVVNITDTCDEDPDFGTSDYSLLIAEDTRIGHTIMQLHAEDLDLGVYGTVTYHIKTVCTQKVVGDTCITLPEAEQLFDLDMETGNLVLQQELDREEQARYDIVVEAVDGCGLSSTATVAIQVQDINDNEPTIVYIGLNQILENRPFAFLGLISVADPDLGVNGTVVVELFDNSTEHLIVPENFRIVQVMTPNRYRFELIKELNRELVDGYSLVIVARDSGTPALSSTYPLPINVLDKNDHRPVS